MTEAEVIKKFASSVIDTVEKARVLAKAASNRKEMQKAASAATFEFDSAKLEKAANAVVKLYGDRPSVNRETLTRVWNTNPNALVDSLVKVASDAAVKRVAENDGMVRVQKHASAAKAQAELPVRPNSAHAAFDSIFGLDREA